MFTIFVASQAGKLTVRIHEMTNWLDDRETPDNAEYFLELMDSVARWEQHNQKQRDSNQRHPVTVVCL